jgi:hypothetical protein
METLVIRVRDEQKRNQVAQLLHDIDGIEVIERIQKPDEATLLAQPSLAEEWNSPEDQRWDLLL